MACRRRLLLLASLTLVLRRYRRRQEENKNQKRRFWVRKIFTEERKEPGEWKNLFRELSNDDREYYFFFFLSGFFFQKHSRITGLQGKGKGISLTPHYHFHPLHRYLDISRQLLQSAHLCT